MKLWSSFIKELKIASRGFYFYIELFMALLLLAVLLFAVPENFNTKQEEYIHIDLEDKVEDMYLNGLKDMDTDGSIETTSIKVAGQEIKTQLYESEDKKIHVVADKDDLVTIADKKHEVGAVIKMDEQHNLNYEYYLQGYEAERLKNLYLIAHVEDAEILKAVNETQDVRPLSTNYEMLSDRENTIPVFLTFNGSLMGLFIIAAYIFLDKQEGVIKAYAVTASSVWQYLMSKVGVILFTSIISTLIVSVPIMGLQPNYFMMLVFLLTTGFFSASLGLLIASFYDNIMQAFGVIYLFIVAMIVPSIAYYMPSWSPEWVKVLPTYPMLQGFKEILLRGDMNYVLIASLGFLAVGIVLFGISNRRYKGELGI